MSIRTRFIFRAIGAVGAMALVAAAVAFSAVAFSPGRARAAEGAGGVVRVRIDFASRAAAIPDDFLGFGYETSAVAQPASSPARTAG